MAKAIKLPQQFREEILAEGTDKEYCAFRPGTLYFENQFWVPDEVVDIRVNHLKVRKAVITREVKACKISELLSEDLNAQKSTLQDKTAIAEFLSQNYDQSLNQDSVITVVYYKNKELVAEELEQADNPHDPHM